MDNRDQSTAGPVQASDLEKADIELGKKLAKHRYHPVAKAAGTAGKIGDQGPLYALSVGLLRRTRPHVALDEGRYDADAGGSDDKQEQSFPSGHMAGTAAAARALARNHPQVGGVAGVAAFSIGLTRIAKGAHWPLDVAAGAVIGLAAEAFSALFFADRRRQRRKTSD